MKPQQNLILNPIDFFGSDLKEAEKKNLRRFFEGGIYFSAAEIAVDDLINVRELV